VILTAKDCNLRERSLLRKTKEELVSAAQIVKITAFERLVHGIEQEMRMPIPQVAVLTLNL
jgi:hypothetical protein